MAMPETYHIIIPARYGSSRLPGKPLLEIAGKPLIQHVVEQCMECPAVSVVVATDHQGILDVVEGFGGRAVMTAEDHPSGSDRIAEACSVLNLDDGSVVVNVQGDEPDIPPALVDQVAHGLAGDGEAVMATAAVPLVSATEVTDTSVVKVVVDRNHHALYFSRASIPWVRDATSLVEEVLPHLRRHLGIYAYRAGYIREFAKRPPCALEELEKLEQLRVLWHAETIHCVEAVEVPGPGIDTADDLASARARFGG